MHLRRLLGLSGVMSYLCTRPLGRPVAGGVEPYVPSIIILFYEDPLAGFP